MTYQGWTAVCDTPCYDGRAGLDVPAAASARLRVRRRGSDRGLPRRPRRDARSTCRRSCRPRPAPGTGTTWSTTPGCRRTWAGRRRCGPWSRPVPPARSGRDRRRGAQPHGASPCPSRSTGQLWSVLRDGPGLALRALVRRGLGGTGRAAAAADPGRAAGDCLADISVGTATATAVERLPRGTAGSRRASRCCATSTTCCPVRARHRGAAAGGPARRPALPAGRLARRRDRAQLPAVLRRHLADRGPGGGPRRVRRHPPGAAAPGRGGAHRRPAGGPSRRAGRSPRLPRAAGARQPAARGWSPRRSSSGDEKLPADWACAGTTGYDAWPRSGGLFVDPAAAPRR